MAVDLTGGEVRVRGNSGDQHTFRLLNAEGQDLINADGTYEADGLTLDTSQVADGILSFSVTIRNGTHKIRRLNPRRTLLTMKIEAV